MLKGALAAALTPLRDGGTALDADAVGAYADFLADAGLDGVLALGTNGEGILLSVAERSRVLELFLEAGGGRLEVAAHCGAQSTADTVALCAHAAEAGADAVAVIGPPYFPLDDAAQLAHFLAAARACEPLPFYVYVFETVTGWPISIPMLERLREQAPNVAGMKISNRPWERFQPYLLEGFDAFVGPEALIDEGMAQGAVGAVSALAGAFPEEVSAVVREPTPEGAAFLAQLRAGVERFPRHAALKRVVQRKGVPLRPDVRAPLRALTSEELAELDAWLEPRLSRGPSQAA